MTSKTDHGPLDRGTLEAINEAVKFLLESDENVSVQECAESRGLPYATLLRRYKTAQQALSNERTKSTRIWMRLGPEQVKIITDELLKRNGLTEAQFYGVLREMTKTFKVPYSRHFGLEFKRMFLKKHPEFRFEPKASILRKSEIAGYFQESARVNTGWTDKEKQIIDFVREHKELLNKSTIKEQSHIWAEISNIIKVPVYACAKRWRYIRSRHKSIFVTNPHYNIKFDSKYTDKRLSFLFELYKSMGLKLCRPEHEFDGNTIPDDEATDTEYAVSYTTKPEVKHDGSSALKMIVTQDMVEEVLKHKEAPDNYDVIEDLAARYVKTLKFEPIGGNIIKIVTDSAPESRKDLDIPLTIQHSVVCVNNLIEQIEAIVEDTEVSDKIVHPDEMSTMEYFRDIAEYVMHQFPVEKHEQLRKDVLSIVAKAVQDDRN